ncbi:MAG: hypothetical protein ABH807_02840 [Candidatus Shapirobacteria bacterium]
METAQIVLIVVVVVLTLLLCVIGVQLFFILREVRWSLRRVNRILDEAEVMTRSISRPVLAMGEVLSQAATMMGVIGRFVGGKKNVR